MEQDHPERDSIIAQIAWTIAHTKHSFFVLYGSSGSGKSLVCQSVYNRLSSQQSHLSQGHAISYISVKTANGGSSSDPLTETVFASAVCASLHAQGICDLVQCQRTCSTMRQLVRHIRSAAPRNVTIILDDADTALPPAMLVDPASSKASNVLSMIARLPETVRDSCGAEVNLSILISVREVPLCLRTVPGVVLFPLVPYTVDQVVDIAARTLCTCMHGSASASGDSLHQYVELVHSMFNQSLTGDVKKLLALCLKYRSLYESCEASTGSLSACRALFTTKVAKIRSDELRKSAECGLVGLSDEAKKLLIASYIASHTLPSHDSFFTMGLKGKTSAKTRRTKANTDGESGSSSGKQSAHHLSFEARPFQIRRMICLKLALFPREEDDDDDDRNSADALPGFAQNSLGTSTLEQVRELVDQHLLVVTKSQKVIAGTGPAAGGSGGVGAGQTTFTTSGGGQLLASLSLTQTLECLVSRAVIAQVALSLTPPLHIEDCF